MHDNYKCNTFLLTEKKGENENLDVAPLVEKKSYELVISDEGSIKSTQTEILAINSSQFQPPFLQLVGQLRDTQVMTTDVIKELMHALTLYT